MTLKGIDISAFKPIWIDAFHTVYTSYVSAKITDQNDSQV